MRSSEISEWLFPQSLDIDEIVLIDALSKLPNIAGYCRQQGLTAPMENITRLFSGGSQPPVAATSASERGYDTTSFITLNGVLTMPLQDANLIMGESNILSAMANENSDKFGKMIAGGLGAAAAIWMIIVGAWWASLHFQQSNDNAQLEDPVYSSAKQLIASEAEWTAKLSGLEKKLEALPSTDLKSYDLVDHVFNDIVDKVDKSGDFSINNIAHQVTMTIGVKDINAYTSFKNETNEAKYFRIDPAVTLSFTSEAGEGGANPVKRCYADIVLTVTSEQLKIAKEKAAEEKAAAESGSKETSKTETSKTESSAPQESSKS